MKDFYEKHEIPEHLLKYFEQVPFPKTPSVCLDPFAGTGTALAVAKREGRMAVGYELSIDYCKLALERNKQSVLWTE